MLSTWGMDKRSLILEITYKNPGDLSQFSAIAIFFSSVMSFKTHHPYRGFFFF